MHMREETPMLDFNLKSQHQHGNPKRDWLRRQHHQLAHDWAAMLLEYRALERQLACSERQFLEHNGDEIAF